MASDISIVIKADGSAVLKTVDGVTESFAKLGGSAKDAANVATQNFGVTRQGIASISEQLKSARESIIGFGQSLAGIWALDKAYEAVKNVALLNARYETLGVSMTVVGKNAGYTADQMEAAAKGMQATGISMLESRQQAMRLVQAHIDLADSQKLARIAQDAAVIGNMNSSEAFAHMVHGIQTGQTEVLRTIGLNVSMEQSYRAMAATLGKHADDLTQNERTQAVLNAVLREGAAIAGTYEAAMDTAGKQIKSMERYTEDLKVVQGEVFSEALTVGVMAFTDHLKDANRETKALAAAGELKKWGEDVSDVMAFAADSVMSLIAAYKLLQAYLGQKLAMAGATFDPQQQAAIQQAYDEDVDKILASTTKFRDALEQRRAARKEHDDKTAAQSKLASAQHAYVMAMYIRDRDAGKLSMQQFITVVQAYNKSMFGDNHKYSDSGGVKNTAAAYQSLADSIERANTMSLAEIEAGGMLSDVDKFRTDNLEKLTEAYIEGKITLQQWIDLEAKLDAAADNKEKADRMRVEIALAKDASKQRSEIRAKEEADIKAANLAQLQEYTTSMASAKQRIEQLQDESRAADIAAQQNISLAAATQMVTIARLEDKLAKATDQQDIDLLTLRIGKERELLDVIKGKDVAGTWRTTAKDIQNSLTDAFMGAIDSGKSLFVSLRDWADNLFKNLVLRPVINVIVSPIAGGIASTLVGGTAQAATTGLGIAGASSMFGAGVQAGWSALTSGEVVNSIAGAWANVTAGTMASFNAGLGQLIGTLGPIALGIGAVVSILGSFSGEERKGGRYAYSFTGKDSGTTWDGKPWSANGNVGAVFTGGPSGGDPLATWVKGVINTTATGINATLSSLGSSARLTDFRGGYETSDRGRGGVLGGGRLSTGATFGQSGLGSGYDGTLYDPSHSFNLDGKDAAKEFALEMQQTTIRALQAAGDLPKTIDTMLRDANGAYIDAGKLTAEEATALLGNINTVITGVNSFRDAVAQLPFEPLTKLSFDAAAGLIAAAGGLQNLGNNLGTFYSKFYTPEEQRAQSIKNVNATVAAAGVTGFDAGNMTRAQYRSLVEEASTHLDTEAGQKAYAALLSVAGAMDQIVPAASSAASNLGDAGQQLLAFAENVNSLVAGIHNSVTSSVFDMRYGLADNQGKYAMLDTQAKSFDDKMRSATDINDIAKYAQNEIDTINKAWSVLTPEQQQQSLDKYELMLSKIDSYVAGKGADAISIRKAEQKEMSAAIAEAVKKAMETAAQASADAATAQAAAAARIESVVREPAQVQVLVTKAAGIEVSVTRP